MNTLTTPIAIPNIVKMHVVSVQLDSDALVASLTVNAQGAGNVSYGNYSLTVRDGTSTGIRANATPISYADRLELFSANTPTGFTDLVTVYTGNIAARNRAAETALITAGLMPAGVVA
jgi:hypothetical protein